MTINEAMKNRHVVRNYEDREIEENAILALKEEISRCNQEGELSIQLITKDRDTFKGLTASFGGFRGVSNYIALVGNCSDELEEKLGYYGERLALKAQQLGLNTCWGAVILSFCMIFGIIPGDFGTIMEVNAASPDVTKFATKAQLQTGFGLDTGDSIGRIKFGKNNREWLIAGADGQDTLALLSRFNIGISTYDNNLSTYGDDTDLSLTSNVKIF